MLQLDEFPGQTPTIHPDPIEMARDNQVGSAPLEDLTPVIIEKSNIMVLGPSGVGKTMMIKCVISVAVSLKI
jgi:ATP-dependent Clp protease ATP-binding subunit ClpX